MTAKARKKGAVYLKLGILRPYDILTGRGLPHSLYQPTDRPTDRPTEWMLRRAAMPVNPFRKFT